MSTEVVKVNGVNKLKRDDYGFLFKNKRKTQENHPDCAGEVCVAGVWYWVSGWTHHGKRDLNGVPQKYLSLSFSRKQLQKGRVDRQLLPKAEADAETA